MGSGKNSVATLKEILGDEVGRVDVITVPIDWIWPHPKGHPLRHPRIEKPVRQSLLEDILLKGVEQPIVVRVEYHAEKGKKKVPRLALVDGSGRYNAGHAAQKVMRREGSKHLDRDNNLRVKIKLFKGDDGDVLVERQKHDHDPLKEAHSVCVLCDSIVQMEKLNVARERMHNVLDAAWTPKVVDVVAEFWHTADEDLRERLDRDPSVPPGLLPAVLKAAPEDRMRVLEGLLEAKVTSVRGASRTLRARAEREAEAELHAVVDESAAPDIEDDGLGRDDTEDEVVEGGEEARGSEHPARRGTKASPRTGAQRLRAPVEAAKPQTVRKLVALVASREGVTEAERAFAAGAQAALDRDAARTGAVPLLETLDPTARAAVAGVLWRVGVFGADVQRYLPPEVLARVEDAQPAARPVPTPKPRTAPTPKGRDPRPATSAE